LRASRPRQPPPDRRSATAIERTRRRNQKHVATGRLALETVDLADLDSGKARFNKAFAVNVNVFWTTQATEELAHIRMGLDHDGRLFLFYEMPTAARGRQALARVVDARTASQSRSSSPAPRPSSDAWRAQPDGSARMERLWSRAVATGGNRWQMRWRRKRLKRAKSIATGCDQLPRT
jgi:hypothetical protein